MYALIIAIHAVFFWISYLLGYNILSGIFIILCLFFLFYFSPLFFADKEQRVWIQKTETSPIQSFFSYLSPQKSIILPTILLYIALYGFLFSLFGSKEQFLFLHAIIILGIYALFVSYMLAFSWKESMFFDLFRFHTFFTLITTIILCVVTVFHPITPFILLFSIALIGVGGATFFLRFHTHEGSLFIYSYLLAGLSVISLLFWFFFTPPSFLGLVSIYVIGSILLFEMGPKIHLLSPYTRSIRYFSLSLTLLLSPFLVYSAFISMTESVLLLIILIPFFLSIHTRYINLITYTLGLTLLYFVYSLLFFGLLQSGDILSVMLFIFFLPIALIGVTYFIQESYEYDFMILHYSAIAFSILSALWALLFIGWGKDLLFVTSLSIFGIALLFFLRYFRFRHTH